MKTIWNILMGHAAGAANRGTKHQFIGLTPLSFARLVWRRRAILPDMLRRSKAFIA